MPRRRRAVAAPGGCPEASPGSAEEDSGCCARPEQRHAANARERARMRVLARAFCRLKTTLPWVPADTKLSKLDTLRLAASYIAHLRAILTDEPAPPTAQHPLNLTWPFSFQQPAASSHAAPPQPAVPPSASAAATPASAPPLPPAGGGSAPGWPPAAPACRPHLPPSPCPSSSCSADGEGDADLDDDDCPLFHRQHQMQHQHHHHPQHQHQHHQHHPHLQSHVAHLPYSDTLMHLG